MPTTGYILELEPMPGDDRPPIIRLRQLLKYAGRTCKLEAVSVLPAGKVPPINSNGHPSQALLKQMRVVITLAVRGVWRRSNHGWRFPVTPNGLLVPRETDE